MSIESRSRQYGKVFDHWQIKEFLGSGSGGKTAVFRLVRSDSGWGVSALKIVNLIEERGDIGALSNYQRQEYIDAREERSRNAEQEVRLMDALRGNTNIVDYLDHTFVDWSDDTGFGRDMLIRMELLNDLRNDIRSGKIFSEAEILKIGHDICVALVLCHRKNILHRDIKPENIFQNKDGNYKLGDFGVSRVLDACPDAVASTGIGTFEYGPAEQMTGRYDKRVDIYSLGLVLYELSNDNRLPFAASTYVTGKEVSKRLSGVPFPRPSNASPALCKVILKACAFNPDERYQSAAEFLRDINMVRRKARGDIPRKLPQQEDVKAASAEEFKEDYATVLAKELGLPENPFMEDAYHTVPASANEVEGKAAPREKSYATELAGKVPPVYHSAANASSKRRRSKKYLIALIPIVTLLGLGIGILSARIIGYRDSKETEMIGEKEIVAESTEGTSTDLEKFTQPTDAAMDLDMSQPNKTTAPTVESLEPMVTQTIYLRMSRTDNSNDIFYEYNDDGTLRCFGNRADENCTVNYYIYDDGTLIKRIELLGTSNSDQEDRAEILEIINTRLNYPTDSNIQYRIVNFDDCGRPIRWSFVDQKLNIMGNGYISYDSAGKKVKDDYYYSDKQMGETHNLYLYDDGGKCVGLEYYNTSPNSINCNEKYSYDEDGKITEVKRTKFWGQSEDTSSSKTITYEKYAYDDSGLHIGTYEYTEWGSETGVYHEYTYDDFGNLIQERGKWSTNSDVYEGNYTYTEMQVTSEQAEKLRLIYDSGVCIVQINVVDTLK